MSLRIERAKVQDLDAMYKIEKECFTSEAYSKRQISHFVQSSNAVSFVAKRDNEIVGFIIGFIEKHDGITLGHVVTIDVLPKHRRIGMGVKLLDELEQIFLKKGVKISFLEVRIDNEAARELYRKKGYTDLEPLENYYAKGKHGLRMKKELVR